MRHHAPTTLGHGDMLRVATYNIHKGVRGVGPRKRLEIHNLGLGIEALDADLVFLQEVRSFHHGEARRFARTSFGWPRAWASPGPWTDAPVADAFPEGVHQRTGCPPRPDRGLSMGCSPPGFSSRRPGSSLPC